MKYLRINLNGGNSQLVNEINQIDQLTLSLNTIDCTHSIPDEQISIKLKEMISILSERRKVLSDSLLRDAVICDTKDEENK